MDVLPGALASHRKLCARVGRAGCVEGAANLSAGGSLPGWEREPAGGVGLSGFFVSPPGPSAQVRPARAGGCAPGVYVCVWRVGMQGDPSAGAAPAALPVRAQAPGALDC